MSQFLSFIDKVVVRFITGRQKLNTISTSVFFSLMTLTFFMKVDLVWGKIVSY